MTLPEDPRLVPQVPHGRTAQRLEWPHLPPGVRRRVEARLGSPVVRAESQGAGFTPGFASRLTGRDGSRLFVKAANKKAQQQCARSYAEEARCLRALPAAPPVPRLLWVEEDGLWVVLGFECVEGRSPRRPWRVAELDACLDALEVLADRFDQPCPELRLRPLTEEVPALLTGWHHVRAVHPDWPHLPEAAALAARFPTFPDSDFPVHSDARDDNFLVSPAGQAWLCDWNWPALGPVWLDTLVLLVSAAGDGHDTDAILAERRLTKDADPEHIDAALAQLCGYMLESRDRPVPPTSPHLRVHARWYSGVLWQWLSRRRGWS